MVHHLLSDPRYAIWIRARRASQRKIVWLTLIFAVTAFIFLACSPAPDWSFIFSAGMVILLLVFLRGYARQCRETFDPQVEIMTQEARDAKD